jgi:hypothetical protein
VRGDMKKTQTLTEEDLRDAVRLLNKYEVKEFIVTLMKVWPFITIDRAHIIRIGENKVGNTIDNMVKKSLKRSP